MAAENGVNPGLIGVPEDCHEKYDEISRREYGGREAYLPRVRHMHDAKMNDLPISVALGA